MPKVFIVSKGNKSIAAEQNGNDSTVFFNKNRLHTDETNLPYWNDIPLLGDGTVFVEEESVVVNNGDTISLIGDGSSENPITLSMYRNLTASITASVEARTDKNGGSGNGSNLTWEKGTIISRIKLDWRFTNGNGIVYQSLSNTPPLDDLEVISVVIDDLSIETNTTYTITGQDNRGTNASANATIRFMDSIYWGLSTNPTITPSEILDASQSFADRFTISRQEFDCTGGKYFWFACPTNMIGNPKFVVGVMENSDFVQQTIPDFHNKSGFSLTPVGGLTIFRIGEIQHGIVPVTVNQ